MNQPMKYSFNFSFSHVPGVMKRGSHALIALNDPQGNFILGAKHIYPDGIYRLIGGGMDEGESPIEAAIRETKEEVGIKLEPDQLQYRAIISADIDEESTGQHFTFITHLFGATVNADELNPADDLDGLKVLNASQMQQLIDRYFSLPADLVTLDKPKGTKENQTFRWSDYGELYGAIHTISLNSL